MGFDSGTVSFRRFAVLGRAPRGIGQELLDKLAEHSLGEQSTLAPEAVEYGWCAGQHILDNEFSFENCVFNDCLQFALRVDTNQVPSELKQAYLAQEQRVAAAENPSGFISKLQKRNAKETVARKLDDELRSGKHRRSKMFVVLWDLSSQTLLATIASTHQDKLLELFERTFDLQLLPLTSGSLGMRLLESRHAKRDYEDLRPTRFVTGPDGESQRPDYPWVVKGTQPKDFLGNEFLLWLWHEAEGKTSIVETDAGDVTVFFDKLLDLDCAFGATGRVQVRGDGAGQMPESHEALGTGKVPRKAGIILDCARQQFQFTLAAETLGVSSLTLPKVEDAASPRVLFEERVTLLRDFNSTLDGLFAKFIEFRASSGWDIRKTQIRKWIGGQRVAAKQQGRDEKSAQLV